MIGTALHRIASPKSAFPVFLPRLSNQALVIIDAAGPIPYQCEAIAMLQDPERGQHDVRHMQARLPVGVSLASRISSRRHSFTMNRP
jgi:hypothetical protein